MSSLTTLIFNKVLAGQSSVPIVSLIQGERPKEISCKGALMLPEEYDVSVRDIKQVLLGVQDDVLIPAIGKTYLDLDGQIENSVVTEYSHFIDFFFQINREINFKDRFGVSAADFSVYRTYLIENALDDLQKSIAIKKTELQDDLDVNLEESLFFYPLIGGLNNLAYKIYQQTISGT